MRSGMKKAIRNDWICMTIAILLVVCVAGILIWPTVDLPDTILESTHPHLVLSALAMAVGSSLLALWTALPSQIFLAANARCRAFKTFTIQFLCSFLC
jgi:hypothetical protein